MACKFVWRGTQRSGGANGNFHGTGSGSGDFPGVGDSGGDDGGLGDAGDVLVDGGSGAREIGVGCGAGGCGTNWNGGREFGTGAGTGIAWADEFAGAVKRKQRSKVAGRQRAERASALNAEAQSSPRKAEKDEAK
jgi:hypothetical protein